MLCYWGRGRLARRKDAAHCGDDTPPCRSGRKTRLTIRWGCGRLRGPRKACFVGCLTRPRIYGNNTILQTIAPFMINS